MIQKFKQKGLKQFFESGNASVGNAQHVTRLRYVLALLEAAETIEDMDLPGLKLHELKGKRSGTWAVKITGSWRVTFKLRSGDAGDVDYEDYP